MVCDDGSGESDNLKQLWKLKEKKNLNLGLSTYMVMYMAIAARTIWCSG